MLSCRIAVFGLVRWRETAPGYNGDCRFLGIAGRARKRKGISPSCALAYPPSRNDNEINYFCIASNRFQYPQEQNS